MKKRQAQIQKLLEEILPEFLDALLKETLDSAKGSAKDAARHVKWDRSSLEALGRDALESVDRDKLEKWMRETLRTLDTDKLESWTRHALRSVDADKLKRILRDKLGGLDRDKLEELLSDGLKNIDRSKLERVLRDRIRSLDIEKFKTLVRNSIGEHDFDKDFHKVEGYVRARVDDVVDSVVRTRLDSLSTDELEVLLEKKRATLKAEMRGRKAKSARAGKETKVVVEVDKASSSNPLTSFLGTMGRFAFMGAAGWIAYSHLFLEHQVPLPKAIAAELLTFAYRPAGPINAYQDRTGNGRPLVLIHSINAAASSYEMRPLFQHYRGQRPVYALDLPGFGFSARSNIEYKPDIYVEAILTLLAGISGEPADVVALSLSSEFAAEAARRRPELFNSLTLISPSGMSQRSNAHSSQAASMEGFDSWVYPLLSLRLWARPIYDLLTVRRSLTYYLQRSFVGPIPDGMVDYSYSTSHQPGAEHAPLYFVSGKLFTPNAVDRIYRQVTTPTLVLYDQDPYVTFDRLPELEAANSALRSVRVSPTLGLPHWEKQEETIAALETFWQGVKVPVA